MRHERSWCVPRQMRWKFLQKRVFTGVRYTDDGRRRQTNNINMDLLPRGSTAFFVELGETATITKDSTITVIQSQHRYRVSTMKINFQKQNDSYNNLDDININIYLILSHVENSHL